MSEAKLITVSSDIMLTRTVAYLYCACHLNRTNGRMFKGDILHVSCLKSISCAYIVMVIHWRCSWLSLSSLCRYVAMIPVFSCFTCLPVFLSTLRGPLRPNVPVFSSCRDIIVLCFCTSNELYPW